MLKVSIITIGDEVRIGQVVNTNAAWIAKEITQLGAFISNHITIGDDFDLMLSTLKSEINKNDIIITTGGLGPTHDDITKPVLLKYFNDEIIFDQNSFQNIKKLFNSRGRPITDRNKLQAYIPSKSIPLLNQLGTAPGLMYKLPDDKLLFVLPGVPAEMKSITSNSILSIIEAKIKQQNHNVILYKTLHVAGIFESSLADLVGDVDEFLELSTLAFLPSYGGIRLRIGTEAENFDIAQKEIDRITEILYKKVGQFIIGEDELDLATLLSEKLKKRKYTVAVAESCTGGGLGFEFTKIPGSSSYFLGGVISYSNSVKNEFLNIPNKILEQYCAVSKETAELMAMNCRLKFNSDYSLSITGIAGPDGGSEDKPVGTVWIGISDKEQTTAKLFHFGNDRDLIRERSIQTALLMLFDLIK
ncbi:MAG: hypothetical protein A2X64_03665 [Ignavibacteria bacterium GWF2_33_9]|nr:MAG: hypothetical protein A2X64_03665 [Ignavibacteria bacterium GWF2_33_9]